MLLYNEYACPFQGKSNNLGGSYAGNDKGEGSREDGKFSNSCRYTGQISLTRRSRTVHEILFSMWIYRD